MWEILIYRQCTSMFFTIIWCKLLDASEGEVSQTFSTFQLLSQTKVQIIMETTFPFRCLTFDILIQKHNTITHCSSDLALLDI